MTIFLLLGIGMLPSCLNLRRTPITYYIPEEIPSLEQAISQSVSGSTIVVMGGTYYLADGLTIQQKNLTITGPLGPGKTFLIGSGKMPVLSFDQHSQATVEGFTITTRGEEEPLPSSLQGGGIYCAPFSSPIIRNNIITKNTALFGGGIYCAHSSSPQIIGNTFLANHAQVCGGGIFSYQASPKILRNEFLSNTAGNSGAGLFCKNDTTEIKNNVMIENQAIKAGGACSLINSSACLVNNTLSRNKAYFGGGVFGLSGDFQLQNNILWKNLDDLHLVDIQMISRPKFSTISDGDYQGINGNMSLDPLFNDPNHHNYRLQANSPCHHQGNKEPIFNNQDGSPNTIGAYGGPLALE